MQDPLACSDTDLHEEKQQPVHLNDLEHENKLHTIHFKTQQQIDCVLGSFSFFAVVLFLILSVDPCSVLWTGIAQDLRLIVWWKFHLVRGRRSEMCWTSGNYSPAYHHDRHQSPAASFWWANLQRVATVAGSILASFCWCSKIANRYFIPRPNVSCHLDCTWHAPLQTANRQLYEVSFLHRGWLGNPFWRKALWCTLNPSGKNQIWFDTKILHHGVSWGSRSPVTSLERKKQPAVRVACENFFWRTSGIWICSWLWYFADALSCLVFLSYVV